MSQEQSAPRPQQVTLAVWAAGLSGVMMLFTVIDRLSQWQTVDFRESFADVLAKSGIGLSLTQAIGWWRVGMMLVAALASAVVVLAVFAARRDKGARIALTVIAGPLLLVGTLVNPYLAGFIAAGAAVLWSEPARDWFAGRAPRAATAAHPSAGRRDVRPVDEPPAREYWPPPRPADRDPDQSEAAVPGSAPPAAPSAFGQTTPAVTAQVEPPPYSGAYAAPSPARLATEGRPRSLAMGCVAAWVGSGMVLVLGTISLFGTLLPSTRPSLEAEVQTVLDDAASRPGVDPAMVRAIGVDGIILTSQVLLVVLMLWAVAAMVLAALALRGRSWARWTLLVSAVVAGLGSLAAGLVAPPLLLVAVVSAVSVAMLLRPDVGAWYAARREASGAR